jgi:acetyltransferase-like isoleucine patch superfamily enzyme
MQRIKLIIAKVLKKLFYLSEIDKSTIHSTARISYGSKLYNSTIERYSYVGNNSIVIFANIGSFCSIADNCIIGGAEHPLNWISTSPVFYSGNNILKKNFSKDFFNAYKNTYIGSDVWIGERAIIKQGVRIGHGAVIGMGSVVTHDVSDYEIVAGCPARVIRKRFEEKTIEELLRIKWWDFDDSTLSKYAHLFKLPQEFIDIVRKT